MTKNWKTLDLDRLKSFKKEIEISFKEDSLETQLSKVGEYYKYLEENNHEYGNLAYLAATNTEIEGRYANNYLANIAKKYDIQMTEELRQKIMCDLSIRDIKARENTQGEVIRGKTIAEYHYTVLKDQSLPPEAWTGSIFEHIGPGAFMMGQGSKEQNEGNFTVQNINQFIKKATITGSKEHLDVANFIGAGLDDVFYKTWTESSFSEKVGFANRVYDGLKGNKLDLVTQHVIKLGAQTRMRNNYYQYFTAKAKEASASPMPLIPSFQEMQQQLIMTHFDPMAMDKKIYREFIQSPGYLLSKLYTEGRVFQKMFSGVDPTTESAIEHRRISRQEIPKELLQQISFTQPLLLQGTSDKGKAIQIEDTNKDSTLPEIYEAYISNMKSRLDPLISEVINSNKEHKEQPSTQEVVENISINLSEIIKRDEIEISANWGLSPNDLQQIRDGKYNPVESILQRMQSPKINSNSVNTSDHYDEAEILTNEKDDTHENALTSAIASPALKATDPLILHEAKKTERDRQADFKEHLSARDDDIAQVSDRHNMYGTTDTATESGGFFASIFSFFGIGTEVSYEAQEGERDVYEADCVDEDRYCPINDTSTYYSYDNSASFFASSNDTDFSSTETGQSNSNAADPGQSNSNAADHSSLPANASDAIAAGFSLMADHPAAFF